MSYLKRIEYEIYMKESFLVIRGCSKCGRKTRYKNTKKFRVNANRNKLDIWLIYQCEECNHTLNLAIYERQQVSSIPEKEYQYFLENDEQFAEAYGKNIQLFRRNKMEVDYERLDYDLVKLDETMESIDSKNQIVIIIHNPYQLKIHPERQISRVLGMSRSQLKKLAEQDKIKLERYYSSSDKTTFYCRIEQQKQEIKGGCYFF